MKKLKNNFFVIIILSCWVECSIPKQPCVCPHELFPEAMKKNGSDNVFFEDSSSVSINKIGTCFHKYFFFSGKDSLVGYWGKKNDTLVFIRTVDINYKKPVFIPFLSIAADDKTIYRYYDYNQIRDDFSIMGNLIEVQIISKKYLEDDTIYYLRHTAIPIMISDRVMTDSGSVTLLNPKNHRYFELSLKRGIINYSTKAEGDVNELTFYW